MVVQYKKAADGAYAYSLHLPIYNSEGDKVLTKQTTLAYFTATSGVIGLNKKESSAPADLYKQTTAAATFADNCDLVFKLNNGSLAFTNNVKSELTNYLTYLSAFAIDHNSTIDAIYQQDANQNDDNWYNAQSLSYDVSSKIDEALNIVEQFIKPYDNKDIPDWSSYEVTISKTGDTYNLTVVDGSLTTTYVITFNKTANTFMYFHENDNEKVALSTAVVASNLYVCYERFDKSYSESLMIKAAISMTEGSIEGRITKRLSPTYENGSINTTGISPESFVPTVSGEYDSGVRHTSQAASNLSAYTPQP